MRRGRGPLTPAPAYHKGTKDTKRGQFPEIQRDVLQRPAGLSRNSLILFLSCLRVFVVHFWAEWWPVAHTAKAANQQPLDFLVQPACLGRSVPDFRFARRVFAAFVEKPRRG